MVLFVSWTSSSSVDRRNKVLNEWKFIVVGIGGFSLDFSSFFVFCFFLFVCSKFQFLQNLFEESSHLCVHVV